MKIFQVQYEQNGKVWLDDIAVFPDDQYYHNPKNAVYLALTQKHGNVTSIRILKEYDYDQTPMNNLKSKANVV